MSERFFTMTHGPQQVGQPFEHGKTLRAGHVSGLDRFERAPIMARRVVVGENAPRPIARLDHVAQALRPVIAQAEMMGQRLDVFQPLGVHAAQRFQRRAGAPMKFGAPRDQQVLVDHFLDDFVGKAKPPIRLARAAGGRF